MLVLTPCDEQAIDMLCNCQAEQYVFAGLETRSLDPVKTLLRRPSQPMARPSANAFDVVSLTWTSNLCLTRGLQGDKLDWIRFCFRFIAIPCLMCL